MNSLFSRSRARALALAIGVGAAGSLALAPASMAAAPAVGTSCQYQDGKISGRGSTLQLWLLYDLMGQYTSDVCGSVPSQGANDITDPSDPSTSTPASFGRNWMLAYDYPTAQSSSGTGSGQGQGSQTCRSDAFGGTDIPETKSQLQTMDGPTAACSDATIGSGSNLTGAPFTPNVSPVTGSFPNLGDFGTSASASTARGNASTSLMTIPVGASAVGIAADLPASCIASGNTAQTQPLNLSSTDMEEIWGGFYTDWSQVTDAGLPAGCSGSITRVVRYDNSGTTQGFDNYLGAAFGGAATCDPSASTVSTFAALSQNQANAGADQLWPGGFTSNPGSGYPAMNFNVSGCSHLISGPKSGANNLIDTLNGTGGAIGYADISDVDHDPTLSSGSDNLTLATVQGADGTQQTPLKGSFAGSFGSNCNFNGATLPSNGNPQQAVGLVNLSLGSPGGWILNQTGTKDDITYTHQAGAYPICSLTWDMTFAGEDGNTPPAPTATAAVTLPQSVIDVSSLAGLPNSGSFKVTDSSGAETLSYTGLSSSSGSCGGTSTACVTGVTGGTASATIASGATLTWPQGTGGPVANLTADQRRTIYSYFLWLLSPEGQSSASNVGYAGLPASWQSAILAGFKTAY